MHSSACKPGKWKVICTRAYEWREGGKYLLTEAVVHQPPTVSLTHTQTSPSAPVCADSPMWEHISIVKCVWRWVSSVTAAIRDRGGKKYLIRLGRKTLMVSRGMNYNQPHLFSLSQCHYHQLSNYSHYDCLFRVTVVILTWQRRSQHTLRARPLAPRRHWDSSISVSTRQTGHALLGLLRLRSSRTAQQLKIMKRRCSWI